MMNDLKERALIILIILLFSFWYVFTGYLLLDYFRIGWPIYIVGALLLGIIIIAVLQTVKRMKNGED